MKVKRKEYESLADCIQSDQVPAADVAEYFEDKAFHKWYVKTRMTPEENQHRKLGQMIKKVNEETKWRDIFKIVEEAQRRINEKKR